MKFSGELIESGIDQRLIKEIRQRIKNGEIPRVAMNRYNNQALEHWGKDTITILQNKLRSEKIKDTGNLLNSFRTQLQSTIQDEVQVMNIYFAESGRLAEIRNKFYVNVPSRVLNEILAKWVIRTGIGNFKRIPGYSNGAPNLSPIKKARRLAFSFQMARKYGFRSQRKWYNNTFYREINKAVNQITAGYKAGIAATVITELED